MKKFLLLRNINYLHAVTHVLLAFGTTSSRTTPKAGF